MALVTLQSFERDALATLLEYARIPALSPGFDSNWAANGHLDHAAELIASWARERRITGAVVEIHRLEGRTPVLTVTVPASDPSDESTVVLYGHLDKQPPLGDWSAGLAPFEPVRRGDRIYARGVADDGYSAFSALLALEALEGDGRGRPRCVVLIEASEESGSEDLDAYLDYLAPQLGDVALLICLDSGALTYDRLWVTTSLRGLVNLEVTVRVLERPLHSGSASGVVPSSFRVLRQLLDRLEDPLTGRIRVEALHSSIPEEFVRAASDIAAEFGDVVGEEMPSVAGLRLMGVDAADRILAQTWRPALSTIGIGGVPAPSDAGNVLRTHTTAVLSLRLPPNVDPAIASAELRAALTSDVPDGAHVEVRELNTAEGWVRPATAPWLARAIDDASREFFGREPGLTGEGGSIPFLASLARRYPGVQFVATGVLGPESNAHGIDEMLDLPTAVAVTNVVTTLLGAFTQRRGDQ